MTMKITRLTTHWNAGDAYSILLFLDQLRDAISATYGDEIIELQAEDQAHHQNQNFNEPDTGDVVDF